jgi:hypothetical protein
VRKITVLMASLLFLHAAFLFCGTLCDELCISIQTGDAGWSSEPLIVTKDILVYNWRTHEMVLSEDAWTRINHQVKMAALGAKGIPFVVSVDGKPIYEGRFWTIKNSERPSMPVVLIEGFCKRKFIIDPGNNEAVVSSAEIFEVLKRHNALKKQRDE